MTVEAMFSVIAAIGAITGIIINWYNVHRKVSENDAQKQKDSTLMEAKIDRLLEDVAELKGDLKVQNTAFMDLHLKIANCDAITLKNTTEISMLHKRVSNLESKEAR